MSAALLQAALEWSATVRVVPCRGKNPGGYLGKGWQRQASADERQLREWWTRWPDANVGIVPGRDLLPIDIDKPAEFERLQNETDPAPPTPRCYTNGEPGVLRERLIFQHPDVELRDDLCPGVQLRDGDRVSIVPPSVNPNTGEHYEWRLAPDEAPFAPLPPSWLERARRSRNGAEAHGDAVEDAVADEAIPKGRRDSTLLSLAGSMRRVGMTGVEIEAALLIVNRDRCQPPQDEMKVRELAQRAGAYPAGTPRVPAPEAAEAAGELAELLALPSIGVSVSGCRIIGTGREASGDIFLSDGRCITFPKLTLAMSATSLMEQVVSTVGAEPALKNQNARHAVALMRQIGQIEEAISSDTLAAQWGRDFIEAAEVLDVNMDDQRERWGAFSHLRKLDPVGIARTDSGTVARAAVLLRDLGGDLYVRTGWFKAHVRLAEDHTISPGALATMMLRVGWRRPGKEGRMKATRPDFPNRPDVQSFYVVPAEWDERTQPGPRGQVKE